MRKQSSTTSSKKQTARKSTAGNTNPGRTNGQSTTKRTTAATSSATNNRRRQSTEDMQPSSLLEKLFLNLLKDMYWAERHSIESLINMQMQATTYELQDAFEDHLYATKKHVARLERVFSLLGRQPEEKKCVAMEGLTREAQTIIDETEKGTMTRDAALIIAAQKIEHYEIATYGSLVQLALTLGHENVATILEKTLWDEEDADAMLTEIAECEINPLADEEPLEITSEFVEALTA